MRTGRDRLKIVCSKCRTLICYWVADNPPARLEPRRSRDVQMPDGTPIAFGAPAPGCSTCGIAHLPFSPYEPAPGLLGMLVNVKHEAYLLRTNEHAEE